MPPSLSKFLFQTMLNCKTNNVERDTNITLSIRRHTLYIPSYPYPYPPFTKPVTVEEIH